MSAARQVEDDFGSFEIVPRFRLLSERDVLELPDPAELVQGILPACGSGILYGPAGIGKSFLSLDLALTIASNADDWHGHAIRPDADTGGMALYVAAEEAHGLKRRLHAWRAATHYTGPLAIRFLDMAVQLRNLLDPGALLDAVERTFGLTNEKPDLVVLDTLSRCMAGLDENAARDASAVVASLDYLRAALGCAVLALHHTGVAETRERGSTVFRGAVDVLLSLKETDGVLTLESDKVRDGAPLAPLCFRLAPMAESMVLVEADRTPDPDRALSRSAQALMHSLRAIATGDGCTCTEWQEASTVSRRAFYVARKVLLDRGLVEKTRNHYRLTTAGEVQSA